MLILATTPIGNLEDASPRLKRTLAEADRLFAEDTRRTRRLLEAMGLQRELESFHDHSEPSVLAGIGALLEEGKTVAYVSDAGAPTISDPGYELARLALERGIALDVIPGPSAVIAALTLSGLPCHEFCFLGFFPVKQTQREAMLERLTALRMTAVFFEAPPRIERTLDFLAERAPEAAIAVCREITKLHQETLRGAPAEVRAALTTIKGEFTLVVGPLSAAAPEPALKDRYAALLEEGRSHAQAVKTLAQRTRRSKREIAAALKEAIDRDGD